ncbi:hypothetical protein [Moorena producens]|uniref:hypothetical protein n=1 Tax=Moorena producens TaxID=1155739 RepID=UPI003C76F1E4
MLVFSLGIDVGWFLGESQSWHRFRFVDTQQFTVIEKFFEAGTDWIVAYGPFGTIDFDYYYGRKNDVSKYINDADVIFLGNSRSQFAYDRLMIERFFIEKNLKFYHLGFGCGEQIRVELDLMKNNNANPKLLVLNVDDRFFNKKYSTCASRVFSGNSYSTRRMFQSNLLQVITFYLNKLLAPLLPTDKRLVPDRTMYRQINNGLWVTDAFINGNPAFSDNRYVRPHLCENVIENEKELIDYWTKKIEDNFPDIMIMNTQVPKLSYCKNRLRDISEYMGVPFFQVSDPEKLQVFDKAHVTADSAKLYTTDFIDFFEQNILPSLNVAKVDVVNNEQS